jgi:hypothetical protein
MRQTLWALGLLVFTLPAGAEEPAPRYKVGDRFSQEVVVSRRSAFRVLGINVVKGAQYSFASMLAIAKANDDGSLEVTQTIKAAKLINADVDLQASLVAALAKTQGVKFDLTVAANGEVTELKGLKDSIQVRIGKDDDVGASLRIWSVLDTDAWKELGSRTFFLPGRPMDGQLSTAEPPLPRRWTRDAAHDWGAFGSWKGTTAYAAGKKPDKAGLEHFEYGHHLTYQPPAAGSDRELPLKVVKSDFKIVGAGGAILYNPSVRKVARADEAFRVLGAMVVSLGGVEAAIEMEELQAFRIIIPDAAVRRAPAK